MDSNATVPLYRQRAHEQQQGVPQPKEGIAVRSQAGEQQRQSCYLPWCVLAARTCCRL